MSWLTGRLRLVLALLAAAVVGAVALALPSPRASLGQATPTATGVAAAASPFVPAVGPGSGQAGPSTAPAIDNEVAVRLILPASIQNSVRLPVHKWARADMPDAPGGYIVFIATMYPLFDGQGGVAEMLLTNYLQWDGFQWQLGLVNYPGVQLTGDGIWLAQNLIDITAERTGFGQGSGAFGVAYTADGAYSAGVARTLTLYEIYDLTLTTVWSRVDHLHDVDTSNPATPLDHTEDVDWTFQDIDRDGIAELVATVTDTDNGVASQSTEIYKFSNGMYQLASPGAPAAGPSPTGTPRPSASVTATATPRPPGTASPTATARPSGTAAPAATATSRPSGSATASPAATATATATTSSTSTASPTSTATVSGTPAG